jgi:hypothetical protein
VGLVILVGCSPALNWREVQIDRLVVFLPCKPDRAQRTVLLANTNISMEMAGCEADGALFAVSHIRAERADQVETLLQAWRVANFGNMRADKPLAIPPGPQASAQSARQWVASGTRPNGEAVQARMAWWVSGSDVFHAAVYANTVSDAHTETLFNQARLQ